jgi:DNA-binding transcriptional MocR family regulator
VPSERDIVGNYGVSRAAATKVLATLRADGLVESRPGSGTVVKSSAGFSDFVLQRVGERVAVVHAPCGSRQEVTDLREAATWASSHRCEPVVQAWLSRARPWTPTQGGRLCGR